MADVEVVIDGVAGGDKDSGRLSVDVKEEFLDVKEECLGEEKDSNGTESSGGLGRDLGEDIWRVVFAIFVRRMPVLSSGWSNMEDIERSVCILLNGWEAMRPVIRSEIVARKMICRPNR